MSWVAVVPVKGGAEAKSRLGGLPARGRLAEAFALDTVAALAAASAVSQVIVVCGEHVSPAPFAALGAEVLRERRALDGTGEGGLNRAIRHATELVRAAHPEADVAVVTGDLPALTALDVDEALGLAEAHERSMIPDEEGNGTTALLALAGVPFTPRFGAGSRAAHEADGHVPLPLAATARIRRDVDTQANLDEALRLGVGPHTLALVPTPSALVSRSPRP